MVAGKRIKHVGHEHPLTLFKKGYGNCPLCYQNIKGPSYGCAPCKFQIHRSCGELPQKINCHSYHPHHNYHLTLQKPAVRCLPFCKICRFTITGFFYSCDDENDCGFAMHIECASRKPSIQYQGHPEHLLTLLDNNPEVNVCVACNFLIDSPYCLRCVLCEISFHAQCGLVSPSPSTVHKRHPHHPLLLTVNLDKDDSFLELYCNVCKKETIKQNCPFYSCSCVECEYNAHACCVATESDVPVVDIGEKRIHFSHDHFLTLEGEAKVVCNGCEKYIQGAAAPAYGCDLCQFYLHKSCMDLPRNIYHHFHIHSLTLRKLDDNDDGDCCECTACHKNCYDLIYSCDKCKFYLDITCASLLPSIDYEDHDHVLSLFEKLYFIPKCVACNNFASCEAPFLRCVMCNFNVHLTCTPLPQTIVHENHHQHALSLMANFVKDGYPDQLLCDVCKKERNPRQCVCYYCAAPACNFMVEFNCANIPEGEFRGNGLTIEEISDSTEEETIEEISVSTEEETIEEISVSTEEETIEELSDSTQEERNTIDDISEELTNNEGTSQMGGAGGRREKKIKNDILHEHPLTLVLCATEGEEEELHCPVCGGPFCSEIYSCNKCKFDPKWCSACGENYSFKGGYYICRQCWPDSPLFHQSCAALPHEIDITFHSHGPLRLVEKNSSLSYKMMKPNQSRARNRFRFCCDKCRFEIGCECAAAMLTKYQQGQEVQHIKHTSHIHPLTLMADAGNYYHNKNCKLCRERIENTAASPTYGCTPCGFFIHKSCFELPSPIRHPLHPVHDLELEVLVFGDEQVCYCHACGSYGVAGDIFYRCRFPHFALHLECARVMTPNMQYSTGHHEHPDTCGFGFHGDGGASCVECDATMLEQNNRGNEWKHYTHGHGLVLCENIGKEDRLCNACERSIQGTTAAYGCDLCNYYLHKSCAELPRQIQHRFHEHDLTLPEPYSRLEHECNACHKRGYGFTYSCEKCDFHLDLDCVSLLPSIPSKCHKHKLTLLEKLYGEPSCKADYCYYTSRNAYYLRCVTCNFTIHLWCSPIPDALEHESHHHPLILKDKVSDDVYEVEVCDICEEKRDQKECAYYCEECDFVAEFKCMLSEVLPCLRGERGDVGLRTISSEELSHMVINDAIISEDILDYLTEEEKKVIEAILDDTNKEIECMSDTLTTSGEGNNNHSVLDNSPCSGDINETLLLLVVKAKPFAPMTEENFRDPLNFFHHNCSWGLSSARNKLLEKYGDIAVNCALSRGLKKALLTRLCWVVQSICLTRNIDITDKLMFTWLYHFKFLQRGGFNMDFAYKHLKNIADARAQFIDAERHKGSPIYSLQKEVAKLNRKVKEATESLEETKKKIPHEISTRYSEESGAEAKRISDALELIFKDAGEGLL